MRFIGTCLSLLMATTQVHAQYSSIFSETFETCGVGNVPICQWSFTGSGSRWTTTAGACAITGNYSLSVGSDVTFCEYNLDFGVSDIIAYRQFDASAVHDLTLAFDWKSVGEIGVDYGRVVWSPDGITWSNVTGAQYQNQITVTRDTLVLDPSLENDPTAFIGFRWFDDATNGGFPGFVIDNIEIRAEPDTPDVPTTPISSFPTACDSVVISFGGLPTSPNVTWFWQDTVCGTDSSLGDSSNYTALTSGTYYLTAYNYLSGLWSNNCASITVTVIAPSVANAGSGGVECDLDFQFSAVPSVGTGSWSQFFGPGTSTFANNTSPTDTVTVSIFGVYLYEWTESNGNCVSTDMISVGFYEQPTADAGPGNVSCLLTSNLMALASFGTGTWTQASGPSGGTSVYGNANSPFTTVTVDSSGTYVYQWVEVNGSCSDTDSVSFSFFDPPIADAGPGATILCDTSFTFTAVLGTGTGTWIQTFGPGISIISDITDPNATVSISITGSYIFQWTTIDGLCSNTDTLSIFFEDSLIVDAGQGGTECDLDFGFNASINLGIGVWSQISGPTGSFSIFTDSSVSNTNVTVTLPGSYIYNWIGILGTCVDSDDVAVIYAEPVNADAGPDTSVSLGNSVSLFGQGGTAYIWSPDTFLDNATIPTPLVSPLQTTTYQLVVTDNSGCTDTDTIVVTVNVDYNFVPSNLMTPNGDGFNDTWYIDNIDYYKECEVAIYNRYGYMVFSKSAYDNDWNGTSGSQNLPDGTYYYIITCPGTQEVFKGAITILRQ